jgi:hypothetical protein
MPTQVGIHVFACFSSADMDAGPSPGMTLGAGGCAWISGPPSAASGGYA